MWPTGNKTTTALVVKPSKGFSFGLRFLLWFCCGESATSVRLMATSFAPRLVITSAERLRAAFAESIHRDIYGITLQYDRITDAGLALLLPDLERCANLHELDLTGNDLTSASLPAVRAIILACPTLIRFHLNKAGFTCSGANKFSATDALFVLKEALTHKTLHHLSFIKRNAIPELHGVYIAHRHPEEVIPAEREQEFLENLREISFHLVPTLTDADFGRIFPRLLACKNLILLRCRHKGSKHDLTCRSGPLLARLIRECPRLNNLDIAQGNIAGDIWPSVICPLMERMSLEHVSIFTHGEKLQEVDAVSIFFLCLGAQKVDPDAWKAIPEYEARFKRIRSLAIGSKDDMDSRVLKEFSLSRASPAMSLCINLSTFRLSRYTFTGDESSLSFLPQLRTLANLTIDTCTNLSLHNLVLAFGGARLMVLKGLVLNHNFLNDADGASVGIIIASCPQLSFFDASTGNLFSRAIYPAIARVIKANRLLREVYVTNQKVVWPVNDLPELRRIASELSELSDDVKPAVRVAVTVEPPVLVDPAEAHLPNLLALAIEAHDGDPVAVAESKAEPDLPSDAPSAVPSGGPSDVRSDVQSGVQSVPCALELALDWSELEE
eukprot:m.209796 g.209796  ORF g.209796 m.209796 type:complete len:611 (+) comp53952_c0_seq2:1008-2840(+)